MLKNIIQSMSSVYLPKRNFPQNLESGKYFSRRWSEPEGEIWCRRISNHFSVNLQSFDGINPPLSIQNPMVEQFWRWMSTSLQECVTGSLFLGAPTCFSLVHVQPVAPRQTSDCNNWMFVDHLAIFILWSGLHSNICTNTRPW